MSSIDKIISDDEAVSTFHELLEKKCSNLEYLESLSSKYLRNRESITDAVVDSIIHTYVGTACWEVNNWLRRTDKRINNRNCLLLFTKLMVWALSKNPTTSTKNLCRNENYSEEAIRFFSDNQGSVVKLLSFWSTSQNWQPVEERLMYKISRSEKTRAYDITKIIKVIQPGRIHENEAVYLPETCFNVKKVETQSNTIYLEECKCMAKFELIKNGYRHVEGESLGNDRLQGNIFTDLYPEFDPELYEG